MPELRGGPMTASMTRDREGNREYKVKHLVAVDAGEGPAIALQCPGLPVPGEQWNFGTDVDLWATCQLDATVQPHDQQGNEPVGFFTVEQTFSTKGNEKSCKDQQVEDPLLQPQKVNGSFSDYTEEAAYDRFGLPVVNSAWEFLRGPQTEFDRSRSQVVIEQNVASLGLDLMTALADHVNGYPLWGLPRRCIKFKPKTWDRKFFGQCEVYYTRSFQFDIRPEGFDRDLLDEGTKALAGHWAQTPGTGCTLTITVSGGGITGATIAAAGSGYPQSQVITLQVAGSSGSTSNPTGYGLVQVLTSAGGVVSAVVGVQRAGTGYSSGTKATTTTGHVWSVDDLYGRPADPSNPHDFTRFTDKNGNPCRVVLDGAGLPAGVFAQINVPQTKFVSLHSSNLGHRLSDKTWWVPLKTDPSSIQEYVAGPRYVYGEVVLGVGADDFVYLCVAPFSFHSPPDVPLVPAYWLNLGRETTLNDMGTYSPAVSYFGGDYVVMPGMFPTGGPGSIHVERYDEADFLLLGIPTIF